MTTDALAVELVRTALLCKLAADLDDPILTRRAARSAALAAQQLADLHLPGEDDSEALPDLDAVLALAYPRPADGQVTP